MPEKLRMAAWLDLKCRACDEPFSAHLNGQHPGPTGSSIRAYQSPDPEDGRTMIAVLEALEVKGYSYVMSGIDGKIGVRVWDGKHGENAFAPTPPLAVWAAAEAVMEATDA